MPVVHRVVVVACVLAALFVSAVAEWDQTTEGLFKAQCADVNQEVSTEQEKTCTKLWDTDPESAEKLFDEIFESQEKKFKAGRELQNKGENAIRLKQFPSKTDVNNEALAAVVQKLMQSTKKQTRRSVDWEARDYLPRGVMMPEEHHRPMVAATALLETAEKVNNPVFSSAANLWPNSEVYYCFDATIGPLHAVRQEVADVIEDMIDSFGEHCIRFTEVPCNHQKYKIKLVSGPGCWSWIGYKAGNNVHNNFQELNLQMPGCGGAIAIHEFLHALGFDHTQSRLDRDGHVSINWANIMPGFANNFDKRKQTDGWEDKGKYDYLSIMHYGATDFGVGGAQVLRSAALSAYTRQIHRLQMGQRAALSKQDSLTVKATYCPA